MGISAGACHCPIDRNGAKRGGCSSLSVEATAAGPRFREALCGSRGDGKGVLDSALEVLEARARADAAPGPPRGSVVRRADEDLGEFVTEHGTRRRR